MEIYSYRGINMVEVTQISDLLNELINSDYTEWNRRNGAFWYKKKNIAVDFSKANNILTISCIDKNNNDYPYTSFSLYDLQRLFGNVFNEKMLQLQTKINEINVDLSRDYSSQKLDYFFSHLTGTDNDNQSTD